MWACRLPAQSFFCCQLLDISADELFKSSQNNRHLLLAQQGQFHSCLQTGSQTPAALKPAVRSTFNRNTDTLYSFYFFKFSVLHECLQTQMFLYTAGITSTNCHIMTMLASWYWQHYGFSKDYISAQMHISLNATTWNIWHLKKINLGDFSFQFKNLHMSQPKKEKTWKL